MGVPMKIIKEMSLMALGRVYLEGPTLLALTCEAAGKVAWFFIVVSVINLKLCVFNMH